MGERLDANSEARDELRAHVARYCAFHEIVPAYTVLYVFDRGRWAAHRPPGQPDSLPRSALVALDDDEVWAGITPVRRRWWDIDLYPELAEREGIVGITASPEPADTPRTAPGGIVLRRERLLLV